METCSACDAPIRWGITEKGKAMPLDAEPQKRVVVLDEHRRFVNPEFRGSKAKIVDTYMPHHATCPNAEEFRRR